MLKLLFTQDPLNQELGFLLQSVLWREKMLELLIHFMEGFEIQLTVCADTLVTQL